MNLQKIYDSILEEYLPSRWSIWTAGLTPALAFGAIFLPDFLQKVGIPPSEKYILPLRIGLPLLILFLGTFAVLLLVVRHIKVIRTTVIENNRKNDPTSFLTEQAIAVLQTIAILENEYKKTAGYQDYYVLSEVLFSKNLEISPQKLRFLLEQLLSAECISRYPSGRFGGLEPTGRKLLHDKGLLP